MPCLMFEGATLSDPQFSPSALKTKVLIMAKQAPLKPFVGLFVADMHREGLGVRVTDVKDGTPAAKAGIHKDDWLTHLNGGAIGDKRNLKLQLAQLQLGDICTVRKENLEEVKIVVGGMVACKSGATAPASLNGTFPPRHSSPDVPSLAASGPTDENPSLFASMTNGSSVGGDSEFATAMSDMVFVRLDDTSAAAAIQARQDTSAVALKAYAPWEAESLVSVDQLNHGVRPDHFTRVVTTTEAPSTVPPVSSSVGHVEGSSSVAGSSPLLLHMSRHNSVTFSTPGPLYVSNLTDSDIAAFDAAGVQFVDSRSSFVADLWALGRFADNGGCGYLLKEAAGTANSPIQSHLAGVIVTVIAVTGKLQGSKLSRLSIGGVGGPTTTVEAPTPSLSPIRAIVELPGQRCVITLEIDIASKTDVTGAAASPPPPLASSLTSGPTATRPSTADKGRADRRFVSAFPNAIVRQGYRLVPLKECCNGEIQHGITSTGNYALCLIERELAS